MTSEPNLLNRITITIAANNQQVAKKVLHGSLLNQTSINKLLNSYFDEYNIHQDISLEKLTLDLGEISFHDFNSLFPTRLKVELNKTLSQYQINNHQEEILLNKPTSNKLTDKTSLSSDNLLIDAESFIHFLYQKDPQLNPMEVTTDNKNSDIKIKPLINQLMQIEKKSALLLAKGCLSEHGLQRLLAIRQPALLLAINRKLSASVNKPQYQEELVSPGQLILNALEYIQRHNTQEIPKPNAKIISRILKVELNKTLSQYQINNHQEEILLNKPTSNKLTDKTSLSSDNLLIDAESFIHFLYQKDPQLNPMEVTTDNKNSDIKIKPLINQLMQIEKKSALLLAKGCLSEHGLQRLLAIRQPALLLAINRKLSASVNKPQYQKELVSSGQLILNALKYIQRHNTQEIPKPNAKIISRITTELNNGILHAAPIIKLFRQAMTNNSSLNSWLKQLWQTVSVSQLCKKYLSAEEYQYLLECFMPNHTDKNISDKQSTMNPVDISNIQAYQHLANQQVITEDQKILSITDNPLITDNNHNRHKTINRPHSGRALLPEQSIPDQVKNAGILILWPMLPTLFNQLGLLEKQKFIHRQAQFNAVDLLDHLIWGTEGRPAERKLLNYILCGLIADNDIESIPIEPEKQLIADQWLDAVTVQLPGWKKLSRNDVRQLFLQRPGELLADEQEIKITIQQQPFDALLADWPWPLNIARLPWLDRPLRIDWQNI